MEEKAMKLSDAILKGSRRGVKQGKDYLTDGHGAYCPLGMACLAIGIKPKRTRGSSKLRKVFPILRQRIFCSIYPNKLEDIITDMNDKKKYSLKHILSWLKRNGY